jgi:hypothetical protein
MSIQDKSAIATTTPIVPELDQDLTIDFHVSILEPSDDEVNSFWFDDAATLICDLERKLGATNGASIVETANRLGIDVLHAGFVDAKAGGDEKLLIVAETEDLLKTIISRSGIVDEGAMSPEDAFAYVMSGRVGFVEEPRRDPSFGSRDQRRSSYPARGKARVANR